jgi:hypothetical protein
MRNESHHDVRLPEFATDRHPLGLEYTIRPVRDEQGEPLRDKGEMRDRWLVEVVGPAHERFQSKADLKAYESSPIRDGEHYYCEFLNDNWHLTDGWESRHHFYLSGKVGPVEHLEPPNAFVERYLGKLRPPLKELFSVVLSTKGKRLTGGGGGNMFQALGEPGGGLVLRINNSPPKEMYTINSQGNEANWRFVIEKLRGHGEATVRANIRRSILAELNRRRIEIPKVPWHQSAQDD